MCVCTHWYAFRYVSAVKCAKHFIQQFLDKLMAAKYKARTARTHARTHERPHARRSKEKSIDKSDDYKQLVTHFAEDLQATLNAVEWPAAEVSLQLLTAGLIKLCKGEAAAEQAVHRNLALQLLGNIARSTRREVVRACVHMCMCMCGCVRRHGAFLHDAWRGVPV